MGLRDGRGRSEHLRRIEARAATVRDRFGLLLLLLCGSFVALGAPESPWGRVLAELLQVAALIVGFLSTGVLREHRWLGLSAGAGVIAIVFTAATGDITAGISAIASGIVLAALLVAVLERVLRHRRVSIQTLYGAVSAYFIIGLMFSSVYAALDAFGREPLFGEAVSNSVYSYFSFTTLTTVGFGDYTAQTSLARRLVVMEAVIGQVFIATTLARLVSLYKSAPVPNDAPEEPGAPPVST